MWDIVLHVSMQSTEGISQKPKLGKGITVRVDMVLREKIETLRKDTLRDISDIVRDGLVAFWPEIEALNRHLGHRANAEDIARLRAWMDAGREAHALDIDLAELIRREKSARALRRADAA